MYNKRKKEMHNNNQNLKVKDYTMRPYSLV